MTVGSSWTYGAQDFSLEWESRFGSRRHGWGRMQWLGGDVMLEERRDGT